MGVIVKALNSTKEYSIVSCVTTDIMKQVVNNQGLVTGFSNKVSDILTANVLMSGTMKDEKEEISIALKTDGMLSRIDSNGDFLGNYTAYGTLNSQSAKGIIGDGVLEVTKYYDGKELRSSHTPVDSTDIGNVIVDYYFQSEQVYSVVLLASISDKKTNEFYGSGGILIQLLPNASEEIKESIADAVNEITELSKKIALGTTAEELVKLIDKDAEILETKEIKFNCKCSREKTLASLKTIEFEELKKIYDEYGVVTGVCTSCNEAYEFTLEDFNENR